MARRMRIEFLSSGFEAILNSPGVDAAVAAEARRQAQSMERDAGEPYDVSRMAGATSRAVYVAKPEGSDARRAPALDHETWINEVWPRVGGDKWRPRS